MHLFLAGRNNTIREQHFTQRPQPCLPLGNRGWMFQHPQHHFPIVHHCNHLWIPSIGCISPFLHFIGCRGQFHPGHQFLGSHVSFVHRFCPFLVTTAFNTFWTRFPPAATRT